MLTLIGVVTAALGLWRPIWGLALYFSMLPAIRYLMAAQADTQSPVTLPGLMIAGALACRLLLPDPRYRRRSAILAGLVLVFTIASGAHYGGLLVDHPWLISANLLNAEQLNPFVFVSEGLLWLAAGLLMLAVARVSARASDRAVLYGAFLVQGAVFFAILIADAMIEGKDIPVYWIQHSQHNQPGLFAIFSEHNTFGAYCLLQAVLAAGLVRGKSKALIRVGVVASAAWVVMLFCSVSINSILGLFLTGGVAAVVLLVRYSKHRRLACHSGGRAIPWMKGALAVIGVSGLVVLGYLTIDPGTRQQRIDRRFDELSPAAVVASFKERRLAPWIAALGMARDYPFFGVGLGRYYIEFRDYRELVPENERGYLFRVSEHENAHNYFLQLLAEAGLLGLLLFMGGIVIVLRRCDWGDPYTGPAGLGLVAVLLISFLQHPMVVELFFFSIAGIVGLCWSPETPEGKSEGRVARRWFPALLLISAAILPLHLYHAWNDYPDEFQYGVYAAEEGVDGAYFWTSGAAFLRRNWPAQRILLRVSSVDPAVTTEPVEVSVEVDRQRVAGLVIDSSGWRELTLEVGERSLIGIIPSRTFRVPGDPRQLGVSVQILSDR